MQAAYLLSRTSLSPRRLTALRNLFQREPDPYIQVAVAMVLVQSTDENSQIVRSVLLHPNEKVREVGKLFRVVKNDVRVAKAMLNHSLRPEIPWLTCDYLPLIHLMSQSLNPDIRRNVMDALRDPRLTHPIVGVRQILATIFTTIRQTL